MPVASEVMGHVAVASVCARPGRYGDGPVHIRVESALAGEWRPPFDHRVERNDPRCVQDPGGDYIEVVHSHNAFFYVDEMVRRGLPAKALTVVRLHSVPVNRVRQK